ncbi:MAG: LptF/LptG family permease [Pirellulales bacterium]|nr:LptF/LptG family permease [Pirellulales bacterium]
MKVIDRYLLRQFVQVFAICFLSLTGLYVVFDMFSHLDEFTAFSSKHGSLWTTLAQFYGVRSVAFFDRTSGILALIAAMFTVTWIQRHNELTALMAAGISRGRVVRPILVAAVVISLLAAVNRELAIPLLRAPLSREARDLSGAQGREMKPRYDNESEILIRGQKTFADQQRIDRPSFLVPSMLEEYGSEFVAAEAFYRAPDPKHKRPGGYLLSKVEQPPGLSKLKSLMLKDRPVIITPLDAPDWLQPDQVFIVSQVTFEQLTNGPTWRQYSSTLDLIRGLHNRSLDFGADVRVAIHTRIVQPLLDTTLLLIGLPLVLRSDNRNVFLAIGLCMLATTLFMLVNMACQYLGSIALVDAAMAAWLPLLIFAPVAAFTIDPLRI